jgi:hypothetical protein
MRPQATAPAAASQKPAALKTSPWRNGGSGAKLRFHTEQGAAMLRLGVGVLLSSVLSATSLSAAAPALSPADRAAAFKAAGFKQSGREWVRCEDRSPSHQNGSMEIADLNGDGAPEAWVTESSTNCYGNTAEAVVLVTKKGPAWVVLLDAVGVADTRQTKTRGWPDIEVGGPGFGPVPVYRFNGTKYVPGR